MNYSWKQTVLVTRVTTTWSDLYLDHQGSEKEEEAKKNYKLRPKIIISEEEERQNWQRNKI